ncbi:hypothetical protein Ancab_004224 [Ancistrocladus abbreviatus]
MEIEDDNVVIQEMDAKDNENDGSLEEKKFSDIVNDGVMQSVKLSKQKRDRVANRILRSLTKPSYTLTRVGYKNVRAENRARLSYLLRKLVREHNWEEASGVLSTLLKGTCRDRTPQNNRMKYWVAMELLRHMESGHLYSRQIKHIYDIWMKKVGSNKNKPLKDRYVQLEFIIFSLTQKNLEDAHQAALCLMQEPDSESCPTANFVLGLTFFELWYSTLPKDMQLRELDQSCMSRESDVVGDEFHNPVENSEWHDAVSVDDTCSHMHHSETSVMNGKNISAEVNGSMNPEVSQMDLNLQRQKTCQQFQSQGLYMNVGEISGQEDGSIPHDNVDTCSPSVFYANGLGSSLLPLQLPHAKEDMEDFTSRYVGFFNNYYKDALKYLQLAVNSTPPVSEALLPYIQLVLLSDQVEEALIVLEKFCHNSNTALPFRLRAHLLECFASNDRAELSFCYEAVLKMDPTCRHSVMKLIKLYRMGDYNPDQLLEVIALHLDATYVDDNIWREFASCLLKLFQCEEDRMSVFLNGEGVRCEQGTTIRFCRTPALFTEGTSGKSWKLRCKWWLNRHFSKDMLASEMASGDWQLMACKAACASYVYGPQFEYVVKVSAALEGEQKSLFVFLQTHMQNSIGFYPVLSNER